MTSTKALVLLLPLIVFSIAAQAEGNKRKGFLRHPTGNGELVLNGRIHWVLMGVDDGAEKSDLFVDSDQSPTMLRADFRTVADNGWSASGALEVRLQNNNARIVEDRGGSVGLFVYQNWDGIGLDFYAGYREYKVHRPDISLNPLDVFLVGGILTF